MYVKSPFTNEPKISPAESLEGGILTISSLPLPAGCMRLDPSPISCPGFIILAHCLSVKEENERGRSRNFARRGASARGESGGLPCANRSAPHSACHAPNADSLIST